MGASKIFTFKICSNNQTPQLKKEKFTLTNKIPSKAIRTEVLIDAFTCFIGFLIVSLFINFFYCNKFLNFATWKIASISLTSGILSALMAFRSQAYQRKWDPFKIHRTELALRLTALSLIFFVIIVRLVKIEVRPIFLGAAITLLPHIIIFQKTKLTYLRNKFSKENLLPLNDIEKKPDTITRRNLSNSISTQIYKFIKRIIDISISSFLLILLLPLMFSIALLIKIDSNGPAFFIQNRIGKNGKKFRLYKFRSMYGSSPQYELSPTSSFDRRITKIGKILRRASIDELPQLINVLIGDMSLVGPRPEMPFIVNNYTQYHRQRLLVSPGLTGLWQISNDRLLPIHENLHYDLHYINNKNIFMDMAILIHTIFHASRGV